MLFAFSLSLLPRLVARFFAALSADFAVYDVAAFAAAAPNSAAIRILYLGKFYPKNSWSIGSAASGPIISLAS